MGVVKGDKSIIRKNSAGSEFINRRINFIEGSNVTLTVASDPTDNEVDVTIASSAGGGGTPTFNMGPAATNKVAYWVNASMISFASGLAWDGGNTRLGVGVSTPVALLDLAGTDGSSNGIAAGIKLTNLEPGGASWYVRAGATGTNTGAGALSISNDSNYWAVLSSAGKLGLGASVFNPNEQLTVNGRFSIGFTTGVSQSSGYGKLVVDPADNLLHYVTPTGVNYAWPTTNGTIGGSGTANKVGVFTNASMISSPSGLHWDFTNGRLGIGTSSPQESLHLSTADYATLRFDGASDQGFFYADGVFHFIVAGSRSDTPFRIVQNSTQRMDFTSTENVINDNGQSVDTRIEGDTNANLIMADASADKVGIGVAAPEEMLHVQAGSGMRTIGLFEAPLSSPEEATITTRLNLGSGNYEFVDWTIEDYTGADHKASINVGRGGSGASLVPFTIRTWDSNLGGVAENGWEYFTINPEQEVVINDQSRDIDFRIESDADANLFFANAGTDRVGIGTSTPMERLTVNGRLALGYTTGASQTSGYGRVYVKPSDNLLYYLTPAGVEYDLTATGTGGGGTIGGSGVLNKAAYWTNASMLSTASIMHFDLVNGKIGISTPSPAQQLTVNGDVQVQAGDGTWTKAYKFRTDGGALDFEAAGADLWWSTYSNADFSGTKRTFVIYKSGADYASAFLNWEWKTSGDVQQHLINSDGGVVFNETGGAFDVRIEGDTDTNLLWTQGSTDRVGIGATAPVEKLTLNGRYAIGFTTGASQSSGYGKLYVKPSDSNLYYLNPSGTEYALTPPASGGGSIGGSGVANKLAFWTNASLLSGASMVDYQPSTGVLTATKLVRGWASTPSSSATWSVNFDTGSIQYTMLSTTTVTVWLQNPVTGGEYTLIARQDGTGGRYLNWPNNVVWAGGTTPTPTSNASYVDMFKLIYNSTASVYWAVPTLNFAR